MLNVTVRLFVRPLHGMHVRDGELTVEQLPRVGEYIKRQGRPLIKVEAIVHLLGGVHVVDVLAVVDADGMPDYGA